MERMNSKTPVAILQETLLKQHITPCFKIVSNGTGNEGTCFKIEVVAGNKKAFGIGRSKKEAKHKAANNMLLTLSAEDNTIEKLISSEMAMNLPLSDTINENSIGLLCDFCNKKQITPPVITLDREEGPPHNKMFHMTCKVSTYTTQGKSFKKKLARQKAAQAMLKLLKVTLGDIHDVIEKEKLNGETKEKLVDSLDTSRNLISRKRTWQDEDENVCTKKEKLDGNSEKCFNMKNETLNSECEKLEDTISITNNEKMSIPSDEIAKFLQYIECELKSLSSREKQNRAKEMIKKIFNSMKEENCCPNKLVMEEKFAASNKVVLTLLKERNIELGKCSNVIVQVPIADQYKILCDEMFVNKSQTLTSLKSKYKAEEIVHLDNLQEKFSTIMKDYNWTYSFKNLKPQNICEERRKCEIFYLDVTSVPPWGFIEIGDTEDEVKLKLIVTAMNFLYEMTNK